MLLWRRKCVAECRRHARAPPAAQPSPPPRRRFSVLAAWAHQPDDDATSSGEERPSSAPPGEAFWRRGCAPGEIARRRSSVPSLSSAGVIRALQRLEGKPAVAFAYFKDTEGIGFRHDLATYAEIIRVLSHKGRGRMLFSLFGEILSPADGRGGGPEIVPLMDQLRRTCTTSDALLFATDCLITTCTTCRSAPDTVGLFGDLCRLGIVPAVCTCNILLKFAAESGDSEIVVSAYDQLKEFGLTLDAHALGLITRPLFQEKKADKAFQVWVEMIEMGVKPDVSAYSSFITGLCDCGKVDLAYAILQEINREGIQVEAMAYNMVMDGLCKEMRPQEAEMLLENKTRQGFTPDIYGYSYLIRSYGKAGNLLKLLDHYQAMVSHGFETNCHIAGYLLQCFMKLGMTSQVTEHFQKLRDSGLHLDGVLYNIAMDAYCKDGNVDEAVKLLREMKVEGLTPDRIHYTCVIKGYCLKGDVPNARQAFEVMLKANVKPDVVTYNILASGFCKNSLVTEVFDLLDHMADQGVAKQGKFVDRFSCSKLTNDLSYCQTGHMHNARFWFHDMVQRGLSVDVIVYTVLMNGYCKVGQMEEACKLFDQMTSLGIKPDVIAYTALLDGHLKEYLQRCWQGVSKERRIYLLRTKQNSEVIYFVSHEFTGSLTTFEKGVTHVISCLSQDSYGAYIAASCMDHRIYLYITLHMDKGPIKTYTGSEIESFFVKQGEWPTGLAFSSNCIFLVSFMCFINTCFGASMQSAISPDGTHILGGLSNDNVYLWQVDQPESGPIVLKAHVGEATSVDCFRCALEVGNIVSSSDDSMAYIEKEDSQKLKQKQRERMQPKMGKMDIYYQVSHDAFFKYQTKPKLTNPGDLYYEGEEFEVKLTEMKPGMLSQGLKEALGIPEGALPPWLINMQLSTDIK
ncbi:hypothetical protein ZWY2020_023369 [Hordeum vulgare]|nr:hypothetical protein ZWY2020_023369 [Hordeum vulgare]